MSRPRTTPRGTLFASTRDRFRDPKGWLLMKLPWSLRRRVMAWEHRVPVGQIPDGGRFIQMRRPSAAVFAHARKLADERGWKDVQP